MVRWTTKRNFESILHSIAEGQIRTDLLKTHEYLFEDSIKAFEKLQNDKSAVGILLKYKNDIEVDKKTVILEDNSIKNRKFFNQNDTVIGFIGAGNYSKSTLLPVFAKTKVKLNTLVSISGHKWLTISKKYSFDFLTSDIDFLFRKSNCNTIVIASRHDSHAKFVIDSIKQKMNIFVEKPLCLNLKELNEIETNYYKYLDLNQKDRNPILMIGFNRRFAPLIQKLKICTQK